MWGFYLEECLTVRMYRIMWGSNFPVERLMKPYSFCVKQLLKWLNPLSTKDKNSIASETALNYYHIGENSEL